MALEPTKDGLGLTMLEIDTDGLVAEWNLERPFRAVNIGDVIVEVNKQRGTAKELLKQIQKQQHLRLLFPCKMS